MAVVVITGCSSGFGLETAVAFARRGDRVYATMRNPDRAGDLVVAATEAGVQVEVLPLDVCDDASVRSCIAEVLDRDGAVDVLVNNAGLARAGAVELLPDDAWRETLETNLVGPARCARAVLPAMRDRGSGVIVNVSSLAGRLPGGGMNAPYAASKHALCSLSDSLAFEVEDFGIRVVCIEPGFFATRISDKGDWIDVDEASPYAAVQPAVERFYATSVANGADPSGVATAIVAAVESPPEDTIHVPVGADAEMMLAGWETMTHRQYRDWARGLVGLDADTRA